MQYLTTIAAVIFRSQIKIREEQFIKSGSFNLRTGDCPSLFNLINTQIIKISNKIFLPLFTSVVVIVLMSDKIKGRPPVTQINKGVDEDMEYSSDERSGGKHPHFRKAAASAGNKAWTQVDDEEFIKLHPLVGNKWRELSALMKNKTENQVKNFYFSNLRKITKQIVNMCRARGILTTTHPADNMSCSSEGSNNAHLLKQQKVKNKESDGEEDGSNEKQANDSLAFEKKECSIAAHGIDFDRQNAQNFNQNKRGGRCGGVCYTFIKILCNQRSLYFLEVVIEIMLRQEGVRPQSEILAQMSRQNEAMVVQQMRSNLIDSRNLLLLKQKILHYLRKHQAVDFSPQNIADMKIQLPKTISEKRQSECSSTYGDIGHQGEKMLQLNWESNNDKRYATVNEGGEDKDIQDKNQQSASLTLNTSLQEKHDDQQISSKNKAAIAPRAAFHIINHQMIEINQQIMAKADCEHAQNKEEALFKSSNFILQPVHPKEELKEYSTSKKAKWEPLNGFAISRHPLQSIKPDRPTLQNHQHDLIEDYLISNPKQQSRIRPRSIQSFNQISEKEISSCVQVVDLPRTTDLVDQKLEELIQSLDRYS